MIFLSHVTGCPGAARQDQRAVWPSSEVPPRTIPHQRPSRSAAGSAPYGGWLTQAACRGDVKPLIGPRFE